MATPGKASKGGDDPVLVDIIGIIRATIPVERSLALLSLLAGDIVEKPVVAGHAATILWRTAPLAAEELRIPRVRFGRRELLDYNSMLPVVSHVVNISHVVH